MIKRNKLFGNQTRVTFCLPRDTPPGAVSVVGCFNDWQPGRHELVARRDGTRTVTVRLGPGSTASATSPPAASGWTTSPPTRWTTRAATCSSDGRRHRGGDAGQQGRTYFGSSRTEIEFTQCRVSFGVKPSPWKTCPR